MGKGNRYMSKVDIFYNTEKLVCDDIKDGRPCSIIYFDKKGEVTREEHRNMENLVIPELAIESFARALIPDILEFFSIEEGQRTFDEYQKEQNK